MWFRKKKTDSVKKYTTSKFLLQVLLSNIEDVEIIDFKRDGFNKNETITFGYNFIIEKEVQALLDDFYNGVFTNVIIEGFSEMKAKRKQKIDEYFKKLKAGEI